MFIKKELTIDLPHTDGLQTRIIIEHDGQDRPCKSDKVKTIARILLPCKEKSHLIDPKIVFGNRVHIAEENLNSDWGLYSLVKGYQEHHKEFLGDRWSDADINAEAWADNEILNLTDALEMRHRTLVNADC